MTDTAPPASAPQPEPNSDIPESVSAPFIARPIATSLLAVAALMTSILAYINLPISSLPQVDFPVIQVTTQLPGASADTMASLITAPLERRRNAASGRFPRCKT